MRLKKKTGAKWTPLTTPERLLQHADKLAWQRFDYPIAIHDSCHVTKKMEKPKPARDLLVLTGDVVEIAETPQKCICCGYYNIHVNRDLNHRLHKDKLAVVREKGAGEGWWSSVSPAGSRLTSHSRMLKYLYGS